MRKRYGKKLHNKWGWERTKWTLSHCQRPTPSIHSQLNKECHLALASGSFAPLSSCSFSSLPQQTTTSTPSSSSSSTLPPSLGLASTLCSKKAR
ncbi:hypothetical protein AN958_01602 [Leucoagaricus sp. SymC.cos]|nr:hypothetical protein AN958_01602 [Leucoagaricus sp. SymC.cos]